jgi:hypothetical protein
MICNLGAYRNTAVANVVVIYAMSPFIAAALACLESVMNLSDVDDLSEHETSEGDDVEAFESCVEAFVVFDEAAAFGCPGEGSFDNPAFGQEHEAALCLGQAHDFERDAMLLCRRGGLLAGIALVDEGQFDALAGRLLHCGSETADLGTIVSGGRCDVKREQMAKRVDSQMQLGTLLALGSVITGPVPAFGRRAQRPAIQYRSRQLRRTTGSQPQKRPQIMGKGCEGARLEPADCLLVDRRPGRQVVRHRPPRNAGLHHVAQPVVDFAQQMFNIQWTPEPQEKRIDSYISPAGCLTKPVMPNHTGDHSEWYRGLIPEPFDGAKSEPTIIAIHGGHHADEEAKGNSIRRKQ